LKNNNVKFLISVNINILTDMAFDIPQEPEDIKTYRRWLNLWGKDYESVYGETLSEAYLNSPHALPKTIDDKNLLKNDIDDDGFAVFMASNGERWVIKKIGVDVNLFRSKKSINRSRSPKKNKKSARKRKPCSTRKTSKRKPRRV